MAWARGVNLKVPVVSSESDSDAHPHHHHRQWHWHPGHLGDWMMICLKAAIHPELPPRQKLPKPCVELKLFKVASVKPTIHPTLPLNSAKPNLL
jgi:hypothetical protein